MTSQTADELLYAGQPLRNGQRCRVWHGPDFIRSGTIIGTDAQNREVLVEYDYDIPNEWVKVGKLC